MMSSHQRPSGFAYDGDVYCVDCARDMGLVEDGEFQHPGNGGPVLSDSETDTAYHCGRHKHCLNATVAAEYEGLHGTWLVGQRIEQTVLSVFPYGDVVYSWEVDRIMEDVVVFCDEPVDLSSSQSEDDTARRSGEPGTPDVAYQRDNGVLFYVDEVLTDPFGLRVVPEAGDGELVMGEAAVLSGAWEFYRYVEGDQ